MPAPEERERAGGVPAVDPRGLASITGLVRCEEYDREALGEQITELTHTVYPHHDVYGQIVTVHAHVDCPPARVFDYMADPLSLLEWTYSVRELRPANEPGVLVGVDAGRTPIYVRTVACREALTVDYHCAWDQGDELWMVYLNRIVPAETVLKRPGSVVIWSNLRHPYYDANPFPELSKPGREWVGDWWPFFYAGHTIELANLKAIVEYRYRNDLPPGPMLRAVTP
ncbi:MAG TPA: SRPBCC family protein [Polyangiaceae bacterium]|nr:SRPBCC family protein [Polyangiaceae bacterium]